MWLICCFVEKGALRAYSVDEKGGEHIIQFAFEGWGPYPYEAGDRQPLLIISYKDSNWCLSAEAPEEIQADPESEAYIRLQITGAYMACKRITSMLSLSLEERYINLAALPHFIQRVPAHDRFLYGAYSGNIKPGAQENKNQSIDLDQDSTLIIVNAFSYRAMDLPTMSL